MIRFERKTSRKETLHTFAKIETKRTKRFDSTTFCHSTVYAHVDTNQATRFHITTRSRYVTSTCINTYTMILSKHNTKPKYKSLCTYTMYPTRGVTCDSVAKRRALLAAAGAGMIEGRFSLWHASIVGIDLSTGE